jgi:hypothetical protein
LHNRLLLVKEIKDFADVLDSDEIG